MRFPTLVKIVTFPLAAVVLSACGSSASEPTTLKQQQDAMHTAPPSAADLQQAMSKTHFKTPGSAPGQAPPGGTPPPGTKVGH